MHAEWFLIYSPILLSNICKPTKSRVLPDAFYKREKILTIQDADALN